VKRIALVLVLLSPSLGLTAGESRAAQDNGISPLDQSFLMSPLPTIARFSTLVKYGYAKYETGFTASTFSSHESRPTNTYQLTGAIRLGSRHTVAVTIPYVDDERTHTSFRAANPPHTPRDTTRVQVAEHHDLGNVKVAYQYRVSEPAAERQHFLSLGVYLPTNTDKSTEGYYNNWFDGFYYYDTAMALRATYLGVSRLSNFTICAELGPDVLLHDSDSEPFRESVVTLVHYGVGASMSPLRNSAVRVELVGLARLLEGSTREHGDLQHQAAIGLQYSVGPVTPGIFYHRYLGDVNDVVDWGIGGQVGLIFRSPE
jgi:hypothetical protein